MPLEYSLGGPRPRLAFTLPVVERFARYRQRRCLSREAGGQLFARFTEDAIVIEVATGPYRRDQRTRTSFVPDPRQEAQDIQEFFAQRLHFVGNWHTHPQHIPTPSGTDTVNTRARFLQSDHTLQAFIMVVVGREDFPKGLWVALIDGKYLRNLALSQAVPISAAP